MKAAFGNAAQQIPEIDFIERDGREVDRNRGMEQRGIEYERHFCLQHDRDRLDQGGHCGKQQNSPACAEAAPGDQHHQRNGA